MSIRFHLSSNFPGEAATCSFSQTPDMVVVEKLMFGGTMCEAFSANSHYFCQQYFFKLFDNR